MAPKKVVVVEVELNSDNVERIDFDSKHTLLDWDVIVFFPDIANMLNHSESYQGKISLNENDSFRLKERCEHWRREIKLALDAGRTVICYLEELKEIFVDTGQRNYSGTGKNRHTTRLVSLYSNYESLPVSLKPRNASGSSMKLSPKASVLSQYWSEFGGESTFEVTLHGSPPTASITTKAGDQVVGGIYRTTSGGNFVTLPMLTFYQDDFFSGGDFNETAKVFAEKIIHSWLGIDASLRSETELTPAPQWAEGGVYLLHAEASLKAKLLEAEQRLTEAQKQKEEAADSLLEAGSLRALLYEKGAPLEKAIIRALTALGFEAESYKDAESEFDVVFRSAEGRLLGEAEGKDNKPINIEKLRQLSMNIHEDLARDEVNTQAKPVLFGNGYRLQAPSERGQQFTDKCVSSAKSSGTSLVATTDLFRVAKYVSDSDDTAFAALCRAALLQASGMVAFPNEPVTLQHPIQPLTASPFSNDGIGEEFATDGA
ncbi:hypothetical protein ACXHXG_00175 [Rhizobium sp. LEGMi198b]